MATWRSSMMKRRRSSDFADGALPLRSSLQTPPTRCESFRQTGSAFRARWSACFGGIDLSLPARDLLGLGLHHARACSLNGRNLGFRSLAAGQVPMDGRNPVLWLV